MIPTDPTHESAPDTPGSPANAGDEPMEAPAAMDTGAAAEAQRAALDAVIAEHRDKYLRLAAEFENFRKRAARDREHAERHGQSVVIRGLLETLDDLARFAHLDPWKAEVETVIDGARMVEQKLLKSLAGHGLEVINPLGHAFDPAFHEAVSTTPASAPDEDNLVAQVFQVGYVYSGQLLRAARVVVKQYTAA